MRIDLRARRKVIDVGRSSVVTLPASWTREHKIKPGDYLILTARGRRLELEPLETTEGQRAEE